jgi:hypothetical protein
MNSHKIHQKCNGILIKFAIILIKCNRTLIKGVEMLINGANIYKDA